MRTLRITATALIVCAVLAACGGQDPRDGAATPTPTGASPVTELPTPAPTSSATPADSTAPPTLSTVRPGNPSKPPAAGETTLTGRVESGVEANCLLLDGYLLLGGPRDVLTAGATVTVTGKIQPDMMTTCQQGIPFVVEKASRKG